jgi:hypothetical protein
LVDRCIEVEVRLLATTERGFRLFALCALKLQHAEDLFDSIDLGTRHHCIGLAQRAHDGERGIE